MNHEQITAHKLGALHVELIKLETALHAQSARIKELEQKNLEAETRINALLRRVGEAPPDGEVV